MYNEPRKGTEAYAIQKEVEKRKKIAKDKGLDVLFSSIYHNTLRYYPAWFKKDNKFHVYPEVTSTETRKDGIELVIDGKKYRIVEKAWSTGFGEDSYNDLTLFVDEQKVFEVTENVTSDDWDTYYRPTSINAYVNDEWAVILKAVKEFEERKTREFSIAFAEDPKRVQQMKDDFGIAALPLLQPDAPIAKDKAKISGKFWVWVVVIIIVLIFLGNS